MIDVLDKKLEEQDVDMHGKIKAWSHSRLTVFEQCPKRTEIAVIQRVPEPPRPLPPGKTEHANDRGTRLHDAAERYVPGGVELLPELAKYFEPEFKRLKELHKKGVVSLEGDWAFNRDWQPTAWMSADCWVRVKCDAVVFVNATEAIIIDYKSGRRFGNEVKHGEQMQIYQLAAFLRYPKLKKVTVELWYLDQDELVSLTYTRDQGLRFLKGFDKRGERLTTCEEFEARPSFHACKYCPYKPVEKGGTGHCPEGV